MSILGLVITIAFFLLPQFTGDPRERKKSQEEETANSSILRNNPSSFQTGVTSKSHNGEATKKANSGIPVKKLSKEHGLGFFKINLILPSAMEGASIIVDNLNPVILERTETVVVIEVPVKKGSYEFSIEKEGYVTCSTKKAIRMDNDTLTPCQI